MRRACESTTALDRWCGRHRRSAALVASLAMIATAVVVPSTAAVAASKATAVSHAKKHYTIGVSFYTNALPIYINMADGMKTEAKKLGVTLDFSYANFSASEQSNQINDFVTRHVNMIMASPVSYNALVPAYKAAKSAGIPIFSVANNVPLKDETGFVGQNIIRVGEEQINFVSKQLHGHGQVAEIAGPPTIYFVGQEKIGWRKALAKHKGLHLVATETDATLSTATGLTLADDILTAHPTVKAIVSSVDTIALGAAEALQQQGVTPGTVVLAGLDGDPRVVAQIKHNGYIRFTVSELGKTWGKIAVKTANSFLNGHKPKHKSVTTPYQIITTSNVHKLTKKQLSKLTTA